MTALAMRQAGLKPAAKIVLYWLADHHNETTGQCFPSIARLADLCEMSRRSVEQHLSDLEASGLIERQARHRPEGGKTSNSYILHLRESDAQNLRIPPAKSAHGGCAKSAHDITLEDTNLGIEQEEEAKASLSPGGDLADAVTAYNIAAKESGWPQVQVLSKQRRSALAARLRECGGLAGWQAALAKAQASPHLCGENDRGWTCSFDFLAKQSSFAKLMEGNYDRRQDARRAGAHRSADGADAALENILRLAGVGEA